MGLLYFVKPEMVIDVRRDVIGVSKLVLSKFIIRVGFVCGYCFISLVYISEFYCFHGIIHVSLFL